MSKVFKILIVDDNSIARLAIKRILSKNSNLEIVGEVGNYKYVLDFFNREEIDIVLIPEKMGIINGNKIIEFLNKEYPKLKILITITNYPEEKVKKDGIYFLDKWEVYNGNLNELILKNVS